MSILERLNSIRNRESEFVLIYFLLSTYNFRISEVLNLNYNSLVSPHFIIFKLSKSKDSYIVQNSELYNILKNLFSFNSCKSFSVNYKQYYRWHLNQHFSDVIYHKGKNLKVTHSFRYKNTKIFTDSLRTNKEIQALLRHSSLKSQLSYKL